MIMTRTITISRIMIMVAIIMVTMLMIINRNIKNNNDTSYHNYYNNIDTGRDGIG